MDRFRHYAARCDPPPWPERAAPIIPNMTRKGDCVQDTVCAPWPTCGYSRACERLAFDPLAARHASALTATGAFWVCMALLHPAKITEADA